MPNNYFKFKKFTVMQESVSMKVSSDAVLFGSCVDTLNCENILDIGTGTGLLSLMLAQKNENSKIEAIEIDQQAFEKARLNFFNSPWANRLHVRYIDWNSFWPSLTKKYDLIVCNPPFFSGDLLPKDKKRVFSRHQQTLKYEELMKGAYRLLSEGGTFFLLVPYQLKEKVIIIGENNQLYCNKIINVKSSPIKNFHRSVLIFERSNNQNPGQEIIIRNEDGSYTEMYKKLCGDFYIFL